MTESEQRRFEMLLEQVLHEVRTVAEGRSALDAKMERFHKEAKEDHRVVMDLLKFSHDELDKKIDGVHDKLDKKIDGVRDELKEEIRAVDKRSGERDERLTAEIRAVDNKVDGHETRIATLEQKVA